MGHINTEVTGFGVSLRARASSSSRTYLRLNTLTLKRPDDWHLHLRDGEALSAVLPFTAARFARAIVMPNLKPPITTTEQALAYRGRILDALPKGMSFEPLMTLYLTDNTTPAEVDRAKASGLVHGFKLYPAGATTNSDSGVTDIRRVEAVLGRMSELGLVLQIHGEVTHPDVDVFDREARFIDSVLAPTVERFGRLKIVFEHITTSAAARFVLHARKGVAATITPQHLLMNRNALFNGGIRPHLYCLPVLKTEPDRRTLLDGHAGGESALFLGHRQSASRTPGTPRRLPADVPAFSPRTPVSSSTPRRSSTSVRWRSWKALPASSVLTSTACHGTRKGSRSSRRNGMFRHTTRLATQSSCPYGLANG